MVKSLLVALVRRRNLRALASRKLGTKPPNSSQLSCVRYSPGKHLGKFLTIAGFPKLLAGVLRIQISQHGESHSDCCFCNAGRPGSAGQGSNKERKKRDKDQQRPLPQGGLSALTAAQQAQQPRPPQVNAPVPGGQALSQTRGVETAPQGGDKGVVSVNHPGAGVSPPGTHPVVAAPPHGVGASVGQGVVGAPTQEAKQAGGAAGAGVDGSFRQGRPAQLGSQAQVSCPCG